MEEKDKRVSARWEQILAKEEFNKPCVHVSKYDWIYSIDHIWVTFSSTKTPNSILQAYEPVHPIIYCFKTIFQFCFKDQEQELIEFKGQKIEVKKAVEPDQIIWANLKFSFKEQTFRSRIVFMLSLLTILGVILITSSTDAINSLFSRGNCPEQLEEFADIYSQQLGYMLANQVKSGKNQSVSLQDNMYCYCKDLTSGGQEFWLANSVRKEVQKIDPYDNQSYCWLYIREMIVSTILLEGSAAITAIINSVIAFIFFFLGHYLVKHTTIETQVQSFTYILILEYINMGIIKMIQAFDPSQKLQQLSGDDTQYEGFDYKFYQNVGAKISSTIFLSVILTNIGAVKKLAKTLFMRFLDRGFQFDLKKDPEDEDDDEPNSKKKTQAELEELYMGEDYEGEGSFSRMMSHLLILITFSSGMPNLYITGFLFFTFTYLIEKWNLILVNKKTNALNRVIPMYSTSLFNFAIVLHFFIGLFMLTNEQLFYSKTNNDDGQQSIPGFLDQLQSANSIGFIAKRAQKAHEKIYLIWMLVAFFTYFTGSFIKGIFVLIYLQIVKIIRRITNCLKQAAEKVPSALITSTRAINRLSIKKVSKNHKTYARTSTQDFNEQMKKFELIHIKMGPEEENKEESSFISDSNNEISDPKHLTVQEIRKKRMKPIELYEYAKSVINIDFSKLNSSENEEQDEDGDDLNSQKIDRKKIYSQRKLTTSGMILILKFGFAIKNTVLQYLDKDLMLTNQEIKRREQLMAKFKLLALEPNASESIYQEVNISNLIKFYKRAKKDYEEIKQFFNISPETTEIVLKPVISKYAKKDPLRICFEEICYINRVTDKEVLNYLQLHEQRIDDIEEVIDNHINLVKGDIIQIKRDQLQRKMNSINDTKKNQQTSPVKTKSFASLEKLASEFKSNQDIIEDKLKQDPELQFDNFSYEKKLEKLYEFETTLMNADKKQPANRSGIQTICRMTGSISQSYCILDQEDYKMASKIYYNEAQRPNINK